MFDNSLTVHSSPAIVQLKCVWEAGITYIFTECLELKVICGDILKEMGAGQQEEFTPIRLDATFVSQKTTI
jgi:hypothetical protein